MWGNLAYDAPFYLTSRANEYKASGRELPGPEPSRRASTGRARNIAALPGSASLEAELATESPSVARITLVYFEAGGGHLLECHWRKFQPDIVVSLIPHFNRHLAESVRKVFPGHPLVTILTDLADYPRHFRIERESDYLICATERAASTSGMDVNPVKRLLEPATLARLRESALALRNRAVFEVPEILETILQKTTRRRRCGESRKESWAAKIGEVRDPNGPAT